METEHDNDGSRPLERLVSTHFCRRYGVNWKRLIYHLDGTEATLGEHNRAHEFAVFCWGALAVISIVVSLSLFASCSHKPTADELYGCTPAQQAPNGECK